MIPLEPSLLKSIIDQPDDDLPRLVAADWWQERGETERAEFIRVQIALEKATKAHGDVSREFTFTCGCDWCRLKCKARELCHGQPYPNGKRWSGKPLTEIPDAEYSFSRGFIESITCSWSDWLQHADAIRTTTPLRKVTLTTWPDTPQHVAAAESWDPIPGHTLPVRLGWRYPGQAISYDWPVRRTAVDFIRLAWPGLEFTLPDRSRIEYTGVLDLPADGEFIPIPAGIGENG